VLFLRRPSIPAAIVGVSLISAWASAVIGVPLGSPTSTFPSHLDDLQILSRVDVKGYAAGALRTRHGFFVNAQDKRWSYLKVALNRYA